MIGEDAPHPPDWPDPNKRPCDACGHIWFTGERRHAYVAHEGEGPEQTEVLCALCRRRRGFTRPGA